jgi:AcrR family transcriptional regulator
MAESGKRNYLSVSRAESARRTRRAVVDAAAALFLRDGFGRTTVDAVADAAGVSRKTVFRVAGGKVELLKLAIDWAVVGDDEDVPLAGRTQIVQLVSESSADGVLAEWAALTATIGSRVAGLSRVLIEAAGVDPAARDLRSHAQAQRYHGATAFADFLATRKWVPAEVGIDRVADIVWLFSDPAIYDQMVVERNWSHQDFVTWLTRTIGAELRA